MDDDYKIKPFGIILPKMTTYVKRLDCETKWMYFVIEDNEFKKYLLIFGMKSGSP